MKLRFLQIIVCCLILCSCESCEEKEWKTLPPKTQKGANTFGCNLNGELLVPRKNYLFAPRSLYAIYEGQKLYISCISTDNQSYFNLMIDRPQENINNPLTFDLFNSNITNDCYKFGCIDCSGVYITKFDTINRIVSGTFEFSGGCLSYILDESGELVQIYAGDSVIHITEGRFDIKLELSNSDY